MYNTKNWTKIINGKQSSSELLKSNYWKFDDFNTSAWLLLPWYKLIFNDLIM